MTAQTNPLSTMLVDDQSNLTTTSRRISKLTGKRHDNVLRDIDEMLQELAGGGVLNSEDTPSTMQCPIADVPGWSKESWIDAQNGQTYEEYVLDEDLALTLFTGYSRKLRYALVKDWRGLKTESLNREVEMRREMKIESANKSPTYAEVLKYLDKKYAQFFSKKNMQAWNDTPRNMMAKAPAGLTGLDVAIANTEFYAKNIGKLIKIEDDKERLLAPKVLKLKLTGGSK